MVPFGHDLKTILRPSGFMFQAPNQKISLNNADTMKFSPDSPFWSLWLYKKWSTAGSGLLLSHYTTFEKKWTNNFFSKSNVIFVYFSLILKIIIEK